MTKKILIPLVILGVVLATGLGIYIASSQSAQPTANQTGALPKNELFIKEIDRTLAPSQSLGKLHYTLNGPSSIFIFSDAYEKLEGCEGKPLGELQLKGQAGETTQLPEKAIAVGGDYGYAILAAQPQGECGKETGMSLADDLQTVLEAGK